MKKISIPLAFFLFTCLTSLKSVSAGKVKPEKLIQNEAVLIIEGPGFTKEMKYHFLPDMVSVGGYEKSGKTTKISITRTFANDETITIEADFDLLKQGSLDLDPAKDGTAGHAGIFYRKLSADETHTIDLSLLSSGGKITIDVYSPEYVKGSLAGTFETADKKHYKVQCSFTIMKTI